MSTTSDTTLTENAAKKPSRAFQALLFATLTICGASMVLTIGTAVLASAN